MIINSLKKIIQNKYEIPIAPINSINSSMIIKETKPEAKLKRVEITGFASEYTYAFKPDKEEKIKTISKYFSSSEEKISKVCDAVIFTKLNEKDYVFLCELKSGKPEAEDYMMKYKNSALFIDYLISLLNSFYLKDAPIKPTKKYILFDTKRQEVRIKYKPGKVLVSPKNEEYDGFNVSLYKIHRGSFNKLKGDISSDIYININKLRI